MRPLDEKRAADQRPDHPDLIPCSRRIIEASVPASVRLQASVRHMVVTIPESGADRGARAMRSWGIQSCRWRLEDE